MFLEKAEMKSTVMGYQLDEITDEDDSIIDMGIEAGVEEVRSYLTSNSKKNWLDGRPLYDVEAIFGATGTARNALLLELTKTVALWWIIRRCNADVIYDNVKERYDRAIKYLMQIGKGEVTLSTLPLLPENLSETDGSKPWRQGGRPKFIHE